MATEGPGSGSDGLGETKSEATSESGYVSDTDAPVSVPPAHWKEYAVSNGAAQLPTRTLTAIGTMPQYLSGGASAYVDSYSVTVHAQPYNFRRTYYSNQNPPASVVATDGDLQFHYSWSSTSGLQSDLSNIEIHEAVDAPSSPTTTINGTACYLPPLPFNYGPPLHFDSVAISGSSTAGISDDHSWGDGSASLSDCFVKPYTASSFNLTQNYMFYDPATMLSGGREIIPGSASGPWTITNAVTPDANAPSGYSFSVSKSGVTSLPQNLPQ